MFTQINNSLSLFKCNSTCIALLTLIWVEKGVLKTLNLKRYLIVSQSFYNAPTGKKLKKLLNFWCFSFKRTLHRTPAALHKIISADQQFFSVMIVFFSQTSINWILTWFSFLLFKISHSCWLWVSFWDLGGSWRFPYSLLCSGFQLLVKSSYTSLDRLLAVAYSAHRILRLFSS